MTDHEHHEDQYHERIMPMAEQDASKIVRAMESLTYLLGMQTARIVGILKLIAILLSMVLVALITIGFNLRH